MSARDDLNRASREMDRAGDHTQEAARQTGEAARHTKEAMEAGASGVMERTKEAARETGRTVGHAAERAADVAKDTGRNAAHVAGRVATQAQPDRDLERRADSTTESVLDKAGGAISGAAPVIGRGVEGTVNLAGSALHALGKPLGAVVGKIAGKVGGWWNEAPKAIAELSQEEQQALQIHFESYLDRPSGLTYDKALTAYALGYVAAENPDYRERQFEEIEPELRHGFSDEQEAEYNALRDFTRYSYERVMTIRPSQDKPRVTFNYPAAGGTS